MDMLFVDHQSACPEENLALDEALLEWADASCQPIEVLRLWESNVPAVVVGRSSRIEQEVNLPQCRQQHIGVYRRTSGGAAVLIGPGCLMYALVLSYDHRPHLQRIDQAHRFVLDTMVHALRLLVPQVRRQGTSDLTIGDRKFSGNAMRCRRRAMLYHGTLLYDMPLSQLRQCLKQPPRMPRYRRGRDHAAFLTCLPVDPETLRETLRKAWQAHAPLPASSLPLCRTNELVAEKYSRAEWNLRHR